MVEDNNWNFLFGEDNVFYFFIEKWNKLWVIKEKKRENTLKYIILRSF
jgi:hypothetical protein